jgi:hypothetical protein
MRDRRRGLESDLGVRDAWRVGPAENYRLQWVLVEDVVLSPDHPSPQPDSCRNLRRRGPVKGLPAGIAKRPLTGPRRCVPSRSGFGGGPCPSSDLIAVPARKAFLCPGASMPSRIRGLNRATHPEQHCRPHLELGTLGPRDEPARWQRTGCRSLSHVGGTQSSCHRKWRHACACSQLIPATSGRELGLVSNRTRCWVTSSREQGLSYPIDWRCVQPRDKHKQCRGMHERQYTDT